MLNLKHSPAKSISDLVYIAEELEWLKVGRIHPSQNLRLVLVGELIQAILTVGQNHTIPTQQILANCRKTMSIHGPEYQWRGQEELDEIIQVLKERGILE